MLTQCEAGHTVFRIESRSAAMTVSGKKQADLDPSILT